MKQTTPSSVHCSSFFVRYTHIFFRLSGKKNMSTMTVHVSYDTLHEIIPNLDDDVALHIPYGALQDIFPIKKVYSSWLDLVHKRDDLCDRLRNSRYNSTRVGAQLNDTTRKLSDARERLDVARQTGVTQMMLIKCREQAVQHGAPISLILKLDKAINADVWNPAASKT